MGQGAGGVGSLVAGHGRPYTAVGLLRVCCVRAGCVGTQCGIEKCIGAKGVSTWYQQVIDPENRIPTLYQKSHPQIVSRSYQFRVT